MDFYHLDNLYVGRLLNINKTRKGKNYVTKEYSKKMIFEKYTRDEETYYIVVLSGTFVPAEYEAKKLFKGMTYATDIEPLRNYYDSSVALTKEKIRIIENTINKENTKKKTGKIYDTSTLFIGRIYSYTKNIYNCYFPIKNISREYIFEKINNVFDEKGFREIWSRTVYNELKDKLILGREYVSLVPFSEVFDMIGSITEEELSDLERQLSNTSGTKKINARILKPMLH